jgi:site-specific recombinase XerC
LTPKIVYNKKRGLFETKISIGKDAAGRYHQRRFSAPTKSELKRVVGTYMAEHTSMPGEVRLCDALSSYIESRSDASLFSPTTYRAYKSNFRTLERVCPSWLSSNIYTLTSDDFAALFMALRDSGLSGKSLKNIRGLLSGAMRMQGVRMPDLDERTKRLFDADVTRQVTVSKAAVDDMDDEDDVLATDRYFPSEDDVKGVIKYASEHRPDLVVPICLAAYSTLRRSEICGLTIRDVEFSAGTASIKRALVETDSADDRLVYKTTKTRGSQRTVPVPSAVLRRIEAQGYVWDKTPKSLSDAFEHVVRGAMREGLCQGKFSFHALRHFAAAWLHDEGYNTRAIMQLGGWTSERTLFQIYTYALPNTEQSIQKAVEEKGRAALEGII